MRKTIFTEFEHQKIECTKQEHILYDEDKESVMLNYNQQILENRQQILTDKNAR